MNTNRIFWLKIFIVIVFVIHVFDSLYIRSHGDALNYHMYAPYNWVRFGWLHVNLFQSTQYQGGWYEWLLFLLYKIHLPVTVKEREWWLLFFQVCSSTLAYLAVPLIFLKNARERMSLQGLWLLICCYYACEWALFTAPFAKNDTWAMAFFLLGAFAKTPLGMAFMVGLACGIKSTYLYGALLLLLIQLRKYKLSETFLMGGVMVFFPASIWIRNELATGSFIFPLPSARGLQTSEWLKEYFYQFTKPAPMASFSRIWDLVHHTPVYGVLLVFMLGYLVKMTIKKREIDLEPEQKMFLFAPVLYLLVTGYLLEWRTFAGVLFFCVFIVVLLFDRVWTYKRNIIFPFLCLVALASSKIDLASLSRFWSAKSKSFWELNRDGKAFEKINRELTDKDIVLTLLTNEGFFLKPQLYTANEHPAREDILRQFPLLNDYSFFIAIHTDGTCLGEKDNLQFVKPLLEKSQKDLIRDIEVPEVFHLKLHCRTSI